MTEASRTAWLWPPVMAFVRLPSVLIGTGVVMLSYQVAGHPAGIAGGLGWSTLTLTIINLLCLGLLMWRGHVEQFDLKDAIGFCWDSLVRDLLRGLAWSLLPGGLLLVGIFAVVLVLYGTEGLADLAGVFVGGVNIDFTLPAWLAWLSAVAFPLRNPPVEEQQYRGYAQPRLIAATGSTWQGILVTALGFGLQHLVFAVTFASALAYVVGFFLWGLGAGYIAYRRNRLVSLIVSHFISNLSFGVVPLILTPGGR